MVYDMTRGKLAVNVLDRNSHLAHKHHYVIRGTIVPNSDKTDYVPIKITVAIWLEGMDADYFVGVDSNSIKIFLNFSMKEVI